tara:strand:+ start:2215 stop:4128 length:1914 start_codon:yes stop_codon:yes gene_type:complete
MAQDISDSKLKGLEGIQNLQNTNDAIDSLNEQNNIDSLMNSMESTQEEGANMLTYFLDLIKTLGGNEAITSLREKLGKETNSIGDECKEIVFEELVKFINCNINFTIPSADSSVPTGGVDANSITIPVKSVDPFRLLKNSPSSNVGKATYEKLDPSIGQLPHSTNKELFERLNNPSMQQDYLGGSGQRLFTIEYDGVENYVIRPVGYNDTFDDNTILAQNDRKLVEFLRDYYDSIKIFEGQNFIGVLMDSLSGFLSIQADLSGREVELNGKFGRFIEKLMSLCDDDGDGSTGAPISSSGIGHLSEDIPGENSKFWDFGPQDLRIIEMETNLKLKGLVRFVTCNDIEGSIDTNELNGIIDSLLNDGNSALEGMQINAGMEAVVQGMNVDGSKGLGFRLPALQADFDLNILKKLPLILISLILTPKVILGFAIALKAIGEFLESLDIMDLVKKFFRLIWKIVKRLKDLILEFIWQEIKKYIIKLVKDILQEVIKEKHLKQLAIINSLIQTLLSAVDSLDNLGDCRSILDTLLKYLKIPPVPPVNIPNNLVFAAEARPGFSDVRAFQNVLENFQKSGINTEPHPDGSPNENVIMAYSMIKGVEKERLENGKTKIVTYPQNVQTAAGPGVTERGSGVGIPL